MSAQARPRFDRYAARTVSGAPSRMGSEPGSLRHSPEVSATLGTIKRSDGSTQLTVNGWPMYTYSADSGPGQASGQGENLSGGLWWVVAASGAQIKLTARTHNGLTSRPDMILTGLKAQVAVGAPRGT